MMRTFALVLLSAVASIHASSSLLRGGNDSHRSLTLNTLCNTLTLEQWVNLAAYNTDLTAQQAEDQYNAACGDNKEEGPINLWEHNCADPIDVHVWRTFLTTTNPSAMECQKSDECTTSQTCFWSAEKSSCTKKKGGMWNSQAQRGLVLFDHYAFLEHSSHTCSFNELFNRRYCS